MTRMLDAYHDRYHAESPDYANCPYCQDELVDPYRQSDELFVRSSDDDD